MGGDVVEKSNPATMTGRAMGYSKDEQKQINKKIDRYGKQSKKKK